MGTQIYKKENPESQLFSRKIIKGISLFGDRSRIAGTMSFCFEIKRKNWLQNLKKNFQLQFKRACCFDACCN